MTLTEKYAQTFQKIQDAYLMLETLKGKLDLFENKLNNIESQFGNHQTNCPIKEFSHQLSDDVYGELEVLKKDLTTLKENYHSTQMELIQVKCTSTTHDNKWKFIGTFLLNLTVIIIATSILYYLGIHKP